MNAEIFVDANILVYAVDDRALHASKTLVSRKWLMQSRWGWSIQVAQEFFVTVTHPKKGLNLAHEEALVFLESWMDFPLAVNDRTTLLDAIKIQGRYGLSFWDAHIVAGARRLKCKRLLSEDLNHGQLYSGVEVINPFR